MPVFESTGAHAFLHDLVNRKNKRNCIIALCAQDGEMTNSTDQVIAEYINILL